MTRRGSSTAVQHAKAVPPDILLLSNLRVERSGVIHGRSIVLDVLPE